MIRPAPGQGSAPTGCSCYRPSSLPPGRPRQVTDEQILEAALDAFSRRGFEAVSLRELNAALDLSHATIAKRFESKEELWKAAVNLAFQRHHASLPVDVFAAPATPAEELSLLRGFLEHFVTSAARHPELQRLINVEGCSDSWRVDYLFDNCVAPLLLVVSPILARLREAGVVRSVDERVLFFVVANGAASAFAFAPLSRRFDTLAGPLDTDAYAARISTALLDGVLTEPAGS
jgi:TetR/AcrR family transcriptional regulator